VGHIRDPYEQYADQVADAVVSHRPVQHLFTGLGTRIGTSEAVQAKGADEKDVDAIDRATTRAQKHQDDDTGMMIEGASIFYRMMRTFFPEYLTKWKFSGVSYKRDDPGFTLKRRGNDVEVTVGRRFVLTSKDQGLSIRVLELEGSLKMLEGKKNIIASTASATGGPGNWSQALAEAGNVISQKAEFGLAAGSQSGLDPSDSYDARYWKEDGRTIEAIVEPWVDSRRYGKYCL